MNFADHYELKEILGKGHTGMVRRCVMKRTGRNCAVKIINMRLCPDQKDSIQKEIEICTRLKHPHIIELIEYFHSDDYMFMVFEFVEGLDICTEIENRVTAGFVYSEAVVSHYFRQLLSAVEHFHSLGLVHRDLRPRCILLCTGENSAPIKLGGFGMSVDLNRTTDNSTVGRVGCTAFTAPPEILAGLHYGYSVDIWSCGIILFLLLAGYMPFTGKQTRLSRAIIEQHFKLDSPSMQSISTLAKDLLVKMITIDPDQRIKASEVLTHPWIKDRLSGGVTSKSHLTCTIDELIKFNRRRKTKAVALAAVSSSRWYPLDRQCEDRTDVGEAVSAAICQVLETVDEQQWLDNPQLCTEPTFHEIIQDNAVVTFLQLLNRISIMSKDLSPCYMDGSEALRRICFYKPTYLPAYTTNCYSQLQQILRSPALTALLQSHDVIAYDLLSPGCPLSSSVISGTAISSSSNYKSTGQNQPQDIRTISQQVSFLSDTSPLNESRSSTSGLMSFGSLKVVQLEKHADEALGVTIRVTNGDRRCLISRVILGGLVHRQGILHVGDEIKEINNQAVGNLKAQDLQKMLKDLQGTITLKIVLGRHISPVHCDIYVKALFNFDPLYDDLIPCAQVGVTFRVGDILQVITKDDYSWWQAKLVSRKSFGNQKMILADTVGLIPSAELQEWRQTNIMNKSNSEANAATCGIFGRRRKYKEKYLTKHHATFDHLGIATYEEVVTMERFERKTLVLLGAHGIGRRHIKNNLINNNPELYAYPVPHTTRQIESGERNGVNYWFVTMEDMNRDIMANMYVEYGTHENAMYGIKFDSIRAIIRQSMIAVLDVEPQALKLLRTAEFAPLVVFIATPSLSVMRGTRGASDECLEHLVRESELICKAYEHLIDMTVVTDSIENTVCKIQDRVRHTTDNPQWVPISWVY